MTPKNLMELVKALEEIADRPRSNPDKQIFALALAYLLRDLRSIAESS